MVSRVEGTQTRSASVRGRLPGTILQWSSELLALSLVGQLLYVALNVILLTRCVPDAQLLSGLLLWTSPPPVNEVLSCPFLDMTYGDCTAETAVAPPGLKNAACCSLLSTNTLPLQTTLLPS
jgi:hypothetical protein